MTLARAALAAAFLAVACRGDRKPAPTPDDPPAAPADAPDPELEPAETVGEGVAPLGLGEDCDPDVVVPSSSQPPDPHRLVLGDDPRPVHVRLGWPAADPSTSVSFVWGTDAETLATAVEYAGPDGVVREAHGASWRFGDEAGNPGPDRIHEVRICEGLAPGTAYRYRVGGAGAWSDTWTFTTAPPPGSPLPFRVAVAGDARGGFEVWAQIVAAMDAEDPDFLLFSGDFVDDGEDEGQWDALFAATGDVLARRVLVPAHGNHEALAANWFAQFSLAGNEQWFTHRYADLQLVVLNDTVAEPADVAGTQADYVDRVLGATDAPWRIVMHHRTAWSSGDVHGSAVDLQQSWVPRFEGNAVDLVIAGHNHNYERTVPIARGREVLPGQGPTYITTGGAGADLYDDLRDTWFSAEAVATEHYLVLDVDGEELRGVVRDLGGNTIDAFTLPR